MTLGFGVMCLLDAYSSVAVQEILILIPAIGLGEYRVHLHGKFLRN